MDDVLGVERAFFDALVAADPVALDAVLAPDFVLVGVDGGQVVPRAALLDLVGSRTLEFAGVAWDPAAVTVRERPGVAVTVGDTTMTMRFQGAESTVPSRYTHVYVAVALGGGAGHGDGEGAGDGAGGGRWRLLSAQGTRRA